MIATAHEQLNRSALHANKPVGAAPTAAQLQHLIQWFNQGNQAEAKVLALALTVQAPKHGMAWKVLGVILQQEGQLTEASEALKKATALMPKDAEAHYNLANLYYDTQQLDAAKNHYQKAVKLAPQFAQAHYNLGSVLKDLGRLDEAEASYRKALKLMPQDASMQFNLGLLLQAQQRYQAAVKQYQKVLALAPNDAAVHLNMGASLRELGEMAQAEQCYRLALMLNPQHPGAHNNLGIVLKELGRLDEAEAAYLAAIALDDAYLAAYKNLGLLYKDMGRVQESESCYVKALSLAPPSAETLNNMVVLLINQGRYAEAEAYCRQALALDENISNIWNNLGLILQAKVAYIASEEAFLKALALEPNNPQTLSNFSVTLKLLGKLTQSEACLTKALSINPQYADAYFNLGMTYLDQGLIAQAITTTQQGLAQVPNHLIGHDNSLFAMTYSDTHTPEERLSMAQAYGRIVAERAHAYTAWPVDAQPTVLRVGVVSGDLRQHPVAYFLINMLQHLNPQQVALYAYSTDGREDATTAALKPYFAGWKSLAGHHDQAAAEMIYQDGLHVLLDLSGHTGGNKLPIFAWKPAPVQASWLGYWATTGVAEMDYVLVDEVGVPAAHQHHFTETVHYLPETRLCFSAPETKLAVAPLPALNSGVVTFGCFQNLTKVSDHVLQLWGKVMQALPHAQLRWQSKSFGDPAMTATVLQRLAKHGIAAERVQLLGKVSREAYLAAYAEVDMVLDSFPFTGGTTTCEALWMGVPTLTLAGDTMIARQGASLMAAAGLADWIVVSHEEYVEKAVAWANDLPKLAALRAGLRTQVAGSALLDGQQFAQHFTQAMWHMWQQKQPNLTLTDAQKSQKLNGKTTSKMVQDHAPRTQVAMHLVSATRMSEQDFWQQSALGRSLAPHMQQNAHLQVQVAFENTRGLSSVFNDAIAQAPDDAVLVFVHDDVWLDEADMSAAVVAGLAKYDVIGVAGNRRRLANQPAWAFIDTDFTWDHPQNLSGRVGHGQHAFGEVSDYGPVPASCQLLDGVFLAAKKATLVQHGVMFDPQFAFHFYDLDFCRNATQAGLRLGTWLIKLTHQSGGAFGSAGWQRQYADYLRKWEPASTVADNVATISTPTAVAEETVKVFGLSTVDAVVQQFNAIQLLPAMTYDSPAVPVFGEACANPLVQRASQVTHPAVYMANVDDFQVIGSAAFPIIHNQSILHQYFSTEIWETSEQGLGYCRIREDQGVIGYAQLLDEVAHPDKVINLIGNGSANYAHWLTEFLPQLILLKNAGVDITEYQILVDANAYPTMLEALYWLGIHQRQIIMIAPMSLHAFPQALWVSPLANIVFQRPNALHGAGKDMPSEPMHAVFHPAALHALQDAFLQQLSAAEIATQPEKIFIKRTPGRTTNLREMVNQPAIEALLVANGFTSVDPSKLSFEQQLLLFCNARYIVSASGAALVNMLWAPAGAQVVVLMNDTPYANYWYFAHIAACAGHQLSYVLGKALPSKGCTDVHHANFAIAPDALIAALNHAGLPHVQDPQQALALALQEVLTLAEQSVQAGELAAAEQLYHEVLKVDAQHALAHHQLGVLEAQQQRMDSAILHLESAVQAAPDNEQYWVSYMDGLLMAGSPQQALEALKLGVQFGVTPAMAEQLQAEFEQHLVLSQPPEPHANTQENALTQTKTTPPVGTICTLIPGYKPDYLEPLLLSLATQTYRQFKVIISDDNPNDEVTNTVKQLHLKGLLKGLAIEVVRGPKKGGFANIYHLVRTYAHQAEFFHILMDDDLIYPTFYETHMREHASRHANVSISARWNANEAGQPCAMTMDAATSHTFTQQFDAQAMASALIPTCNNKLGEWSHAVFRQEAASLILQPSINGMSYFGLDDIGSFIHAAIEFPAIWIPTPLGIFRTNPHQNTGKLSNDTIKSAHYSWIALALIAEQRGWITAAQAWQGIDLITQAIRARYAQDPLGKAMLAVLNRYQASRPMPAPTLDTTLDPTFAPAFLAVWNHYLDDIHLAQVLAGDLSIKLL